ncbi:adenosylhomocysteinase [Kibdelosporangium banguiense]|uniref:Adenosylhomocysteinase n=1 Tax=Kibdelosporangium banguiense TaxID=1365924 RepID=A0ABS4TZJ8_9PSEU|nr:NAD(P)-dependent oxidoreductase [Kibdelosporangium banguiense]MBP2329394.1 adenosylhomocysteinase [Kibdelosporangium banguiense]
MPEARTLLSAPETALDLHKRPCRTPDLPVLDQTVRRWPAVDCRLVLITHLLDTAVPYVRALASVFDIECVLPVPYSTRLGAVQQLGEVPVRLTEDTGELAREAVDMVCGAAARSGKPVVLQEVGGYAASSAHRMAAAGVQAVVEDTMQGLWRYEYMQPLPLPVFTIADSPLKALEDIQVGRAIVATTDRLVRAMQFQLLHEKNVLVLGYGKIGTAVVDHLQRMGGQVSVYDTDSIRVAAAAMRGARVGERDRLIAEADVIIGVSGHRSLHAQDIPLLHDGVVLVSGSSKQVEFDVEALYANACLRQTAGETTDFERAGRMIHLMNAGKPVNFLDQSVLGQVLDLVCAELYLTTACAASGQSAPGVHRLPGDLQHELAAMWVSQYKVDSR